MGSWIMEPAGEEFVLARRPFAERREQAGLRNGEFGQVVAVDRADPGAIFVGVSCVAERDGHGLGQPPGDEFRPPGAG
jgi:hypothetical protein